MDFSYLENSVYIVRVCTLPLVYADEKQKTLRDWCRFDHPPARGSLRAYATSTNIFSRTFLSLIIYISSQSSKFEEFRLYNTLNEIIFNLKTIGRIIELDNIVHNKFVPFSMQSLLFVP